MLVDAHCHLDYPEFADDRDRIVESCREQGIERIVIPGVRAATWSRVAQTVAGNPALYYCLGTHPWYVDEHEDGDLERLRERLVDRSSQCVAIGECGLDRLHGELDRQMPWFEAQVDLAKSLKMPLVVHSVRTNDEVGAVLRKKAFDERVLIHGFSGSPEQARALVDTGCLLGIGGVITYARARKTRRAVTEVPLECLVLETDAPDMPPEGVAKGENTPLNILAVFKALCDIRPEPEARIAEQLLANVNRLYGW
ncbi:TatD family hydrolase [Marinobacter nanhaiticus D15-8W]|uniref:TatD family deoxyribonuclease n=1 Tax=Marinobacter nanhaiticus D15-8W TaxID=626887 RepID=N6X0B3_9GAMM|nr:TatD family hydrolase [Marinobacter nanhaiticus]ENO16882.1 TatD family deoxyribonuclease [Marinobacter nanhaiticus D15-8W]BES72699.1 TatD family hydrolase [Marinobacter nanhaiticus D15-8W]